MIEEGTVGLGTTPLNEDMIVRYLLGELPEEQQVEIEDRAFQDRETEEAILAAESDLIDEYVRGEIPAAQRNRFESHFLASEQRRRKVEFARALAAVADHESEASAPVVAARQPVSERRPWWAFFGNLSPVGQLALAGAMLLLVFGVGWSIRDQLQLRSQLRQLRAQQQSQEERRKSLEEQITAERTHNGELAEQLEQLRQEEAARALQQKEPELPGPSSILSLILMPGVSRGGSGDVPKVTVSPDVKAVRLQIGIDPRDDYPHYAVTISGPGGARVLAQSNLVARPTRGGKAIGVNLPAKQLGPGRHEVSLKGNNGSTDEDLGFYYFEVRKQ